MEEYIFGRINKTNMQHLLRKEESLLAELYTKAYPTIDEAYELWCEFEDNFLMGSSTEKEYYDQLRQRSTPQLSLLEAKAIVNWIYRAYSDSEKRINATDAMLDYFKREYKTGALSFVHGVIYIKNKIDINIITSLNSFLTEFQRINGKKHSLYYRGHSNVNYILLPSIMRKSSWLEHERDMYNEILIECPIEFEKCTSHLERLVHMQHYGLPTRLLDITRNQLVALYFACVSNPNSQGEVIVFDVARELIKYPGSDTVSVLASLPQFDHKTKLNFYNWATDSHLSQEQFNKNAIRLLHEVKLEKPAFRDEIEKSHITDCFFVLSAKKNSRIIKQDGAFVICGLFDQRENPINKYRYKIKNKVQVFIISTPAKRKIKDQLEKLSINQASLFPEISDVSVFIKSKY